MHVHLLTCSELDNLYSDDLILRDRLISAGHHVTWGIWGNPFEYSSETVAVIRSCWDYHKNVDTFLSYINNCNVPVFNSPSIIKWNYDKIYLDHFRESGIPIIPTSFGESPPTDDEMLIIKPRISNAGNGVKKIKKSDLKNVSGMMIQPYVESIKTIGEVSVIYIGGKYSHTVQKTPGITDFRVQHFYGGTYRRIMPANDLYSLGNLCLQASPEKPLYARFDFIYYQNQWALSEAELIEPLLHFDLYPEAADQMIDSLEYMRI